MYCDASCACYRSDLRVVKSVHPSFEAKPWNVGELTKNIAIDMLALEKRRFPASFSPGGLQVAIMFPGIADGLS